MAANLDEHGYWKGQMIARCSEEGHRRPMYVRDGEDVRCRWCGAIMERKEYRELVNRVFSGDADATD